MSKRERRVHLALKWHHLDNLTPEEIVERFQENGYNITSASTVRDYLNESPKEEIIEQIEQKHADVRLQAAERYERLYQQAREDLETLAVDDEPVTAMVPKMTVNEDDEEVRVSAWERVPPSDEERRPEWATDRDVILAFTDGVTYLPPGEEYPVGAERGRTPEYRQVVVGLERDQPDLQQRQFARKEMAGHMREKADVLGVYSTDINLSGELDVNESVEFDEETAAAVREATLDE
ncbi:hypothetical protein [Halorussus salinus]|uniref:hypothetical protein n=1 Tax=Halorussus salinus TaxID=1364935 RepID=UPI001092ECF1|nr:hypothetical protein [Halorussus salinus]